MRCYARCAARWFYLTSPGARNLSLAAGIVVMTRGAGRASALRVALGQSGAVEGDGAREVGADREINQDRSRGSSGLGCKRRRSPPLADVKAGAT